MRVSAHEFRSLMATFPSGVSVVTAAATDGSPWGMTCSSLCSVAVHPPTLLVSLRAEGPTAAAVVGRGAFTVNLLHHQARDTARLFASGAPDRFDLVRWARSEVNACAHLLEDTHRIADCVVSDLRAIGDHVVVFGEVRAVTTTSDLPPLMYGLRDYLAWPPVRV